MNRTIFSIVGRRILAISRRRRRAIFKLATVKTAPRMPPTKPSIIAGANIMTLTGIALPNCTDATNSYHGHAQA
jgi:hypothetical protein